MQKKKEILKLSTELKAEEQRSIVYTQASPTKYQLWSITNNTQECFGEDWNVEYGKVSLINIPS